MGARTDHSKRTLLKVSFPEWFRAFYVICAIFTLPLLSIACFNVLREGFTPSKTVMRGFLFLGTGAGFWFGPLIFTTIYAKQFGIEKRVLFGVKQTFTWAEITKVTRPRFGIPYDAAYIVSKEGKRITLARSMSGFSELLRLIETRAPNLTPKQLPTNLWPTPPAAAWR